MTLNRLKNILNNQLNSLRMTSKRVIAINVMVSFALGAVIGYVMQIPFLIQNTLLEMFSDLGVWVIIGMFIVLMSKTASLATVNVMSMFTGLNLVYYICEYIYNLSKPGVIYADFDFEQLLLWSILGFIAALFAGFLHRIKRGGWQAFLLSFPPLAVLAWVTFQSIMRIGINYPAKVTDQDGNSFVKYLPPSDAILTNRIITIIIYCAFIVGLFVYIAVVSARRKSGVYDTN